LFAIACSGTLLFQCTPIAAGWSFRLRIPPSTHCMSNRRYTFIGLMNSIVNIITDVLFTVIPVPVVLKLKVNKRTKATLIAFLSLGFVACVAGIIKAHSQVTAMATPDAAFENSFQIWYMLELCLGILAASLPTLKPLFAAVLGGARSRLTTRGRSRTTAARLTHNSRLIPSGPTTFPGPTDGIRLGHCKKGSNSTSTTLVQKTSDTDLGDGDAVKAPYDVRVTGGTATEDGDQWDSVETVRCGSQDRLHHPKSGIFKKVELSHTTEVIK
jgi:hypothetical protein